MLERSEMRWLVQVLRDELDMAHLSVHEHPFDPEARENLLMAKRVLGNITATLVTHAYEPEHMAHDPSLN